MISNKPYYVPINSNLIIQQKIRQIYEEKLFNFKSHSHFFFDLHPYIELTLETQETI